MLFCSAKESFQKRIGDSLEISGSNQPFNRSVLVMPINSKLLPKVTERRNEIKPGLFSSVIGKVTSSPCRTVLSGIVKAAALVAEIDIAQMLKINVAQTTNAINFFNLTHPTLLI